MRHYMLTATFGVVLAGMVTLSYAADASAPEDCTPGGDVFLSDAFACLQRRIQIIEELLIKSAQVATECQTKFDKFEQIVTDRLLKHEQASDQRQTKFEQTVTDRLLKHEQASDQHQTKFEQTVTDRLHKHEQASDQRHTKFEQTVTDRLLKHEQAVAKQLEPPRLPFEPEMVPIPAGSFHMGSTLDIAAFAMGKYEVTQSQWEAVMGTNPAYFKCSDCPVEQVSWDDVQEYVRKLNEKTGKTYRLPTEAEWEYACRGGVPGQEYCGGNEVDAVAWYDSNSGDKTHPVGQKAANGFGLFDMSGNVLEWTCSGYDSAYGGGKEKACLKQGNSDARAVRGGAWNYAPDWVRAADRYNNAPAYRFFNLGIRLVQD